MLLLRPIALPLILSLAVAFAIACQQETDWDRAERDVGARAIAAIMGVNGENMGEVTLIQGPQGVLVSADLVGLPPGGHGFHIHEIGACAPDFAAAGGHFNPGDATHGYLYSTDMHAGDLPNVYANADGTVQADSFTADITLAADDDRSLFDSDGSAIILHEKPDEYGGDSGTAGGRIGCGVINRS